jgi:hypothetical protein
LEANINFILDAVLFDVGLVASHTIDISFNFAISGEYPSTLDTESNSGGVFPYHSCEGIH